LGNYHQSLEELKRSKASPDFFFQARKLCMTASKLFTFNKVRSWEVEQIAWLNDTNNWERLIALNSEAKGSLIKESSSGTGRKYFVVVVMIFYYKLWNHYGNQNIKWF
jgi:hypothetical protein